jgi:opacity protein-like surface antigen
MRAPFVRSVRPARAAAATLGVVVGLGVGVGAPAHAYTVKGGDVLVKGVAGASVNIARLDVATKATPRGGMLLGADIDWSFDGSWSFAASLRPVLSPGFVDGNVGVGARYRLLQLDAPFIPFAVAQVTTAVGGPLGYGDVHWNIGARVGGGVDYWVMRDLAVGVEISTETSALAVPLPAFEWSTDALVGVTWRL